MDVSTLDVQSMKMLAMGISMGLGAIGPGIGLGLATKAIIEAIARQPEIEGKVKTYFFIGLGLIEACAIYALFVAILLGFVL